MLLGVRAECVTCASFVVDRNESRGSGARLGIGSRRFRVFAAAVWALVVTPSRAKTHCFAIGAPRGEATRGEVVSLWKSALSSRPAPLHSSVSFFLLWDISSPLCLPPQTIAKPEGSSRLCLTLQSDRLKCSYCVLPL